MVESEPDPESSGLHELCLHIGFALIAWQRVEEVHFQIFCGFLGIPQSQIASAAYHSTESFAARNTMLDNMARYFLSPIPELLPRPTLKKFKEMRGRWQTLHKLLKDANENRNKLAHYAADVDLSNMQTDDGGNVIFDVSPYTLRPSPSNFVSRLLGRTKDKPEHNLGVSELQQYVLDFKQAQRAATDFLLELWTLPKPHEPIPAPGQQA